MPLIPSRPFKDLERFFKEEWPEDFFSGKGEIKALRQPRMDIYEEDGNVIAEVELPGVDPENIDVEVKKDSLKIEAKSEKKEEKEDKGYYRRELSRGYYKRAVALPVEVKDKEAEADYEDGVLKVTIPKSEEAEEKKEGTKVEVKK